MQAEALEQFGNRLRLHLLAVALPELRERLGVRLADPAHVVEGPALARPEARRS